VKSRVAQETLKPLDWEVVFGNRQCNNAERWQER